MTGKVVRGLFHRPFVRCNYFWTTRLGAVSGYHESALELLRAGHWCAVIPGGAEEFLLHTTQDHAYDVHWMAHSGKQRTGVGELALSMGPGFCIYPSFTENGEEMRWNPLVDLWTALRLDQVYSALMKSVPKGILEWMLWQIAIHVAAIVVFAAIPVPVKATLHIGDPVVVKEGDSAQSLTTRIQQQLQHLIDSTMNRRHRSFTEGIRARARTVKDTKAKAG
eukprot:CAMPEP_0184328582 /NCGR_PEP_ID=MMETSP1049-20130417/143698_1 /TAXON_ID=77928 /ORGANISM="Proteomonas sulcata, Strain CCMP704" /LENGTH=221 /DNA_ID=CAMNT_0026650901 /DNA_START=176 /DNA_END=841 /DNA_ORIENTATION=-